MSHNLTYKLNEDCKEPKEFERVASDIYNVWVWKGFEEQADRLFKGDPRGEEKVYSWIGRLAERIPRGTDKARRLEGAPCEEWNVWELKPKPYRVAFVCICGKHILVGYIWRKKGNSRDSAEIRKACERMIELAERFLKEVKPCR